MGTETQVPNVVAATHVLVNHQSAYDRALRRLDKSTTVHLSCHGDGDEVEEVERGDGDDSLHSKVRDCPVLATVARGKGDRCVAVAAADDSVDYDDDAAGVTGTRCF